MADDSPNWNLNILDLIIQIYWCVNRWCWRAYCSRKRKYEEKDDVWPADCSKISSWVWKEGKLLEKIPPEELNVYLSEFTLLQLGRRKENNISRLLSEEFHQALTVILQGENMGKGYSLIPNLRHWKQSMQKELKKKKGRGNKLNATTALSEEEIDISFDRKVLGTSSPQSLLNTAWLNNILHFGLRGLPEQRNLRWGDFV